VALVLSWLAGPAAFLKVNAWRAPRSTTAPCTAKLLDLKIHHKLASGVVRVTGTVMVNPLMSSGTQTFKFHYFGPTGQDLGTVTESEPGSTSNGTIEIKHKADKVPDGAFGVRCDYTFTCTGGGSTTGLCTTGVIAPGSTPDLTKPGAVPLVIKSSVKATFLGQAGKYTLKAVVTGNTGAVTANFVDTLRFFFKVDPEADYDDTEAFTETDSDGIFKFTQEIEANGVPNGVKVTAKILATDSAGNQGFDTASDSDGFTRP
jgi:hypothetical protein